MKNHYHSGHDIVCEKENAVDKTAQLSVCKSEESDCFFYAYDMGTQLKVFYAAEQKTLVKAVTANILKLTEITVRVKGFEKGCIPVTELLDVGATVLDCPI